MGKNRTNEEAADLAAFVESTMLDEVLGVVKSGKEATVYCCRAGERLGGGLVAAKVYRARIVRQFANASTYNAGRLRSRGMRDGMRSREIRAMQNKSRLGQELSFGKWVADEWETLQLLHRNGVSVPEPLTLSERIILMEFIGDEDAPAPLLADADVSSARGGGALQDAARRDRADAGVRPDTRRPVTLQRAVRRWACCASSMSRRPWTRGSTRTPCRCWIGTSSASASGLRATACRLKRGGSRATYGRDTSGATCERLRVRGSDSDPLTIRGASSPASLRSIRYWNTPGQTPSTAWRTSANTALFVVRPLWLTPLTCRKHAPPSSREDDVGTVPSLVL